MEKITRDKIAVAVYASILPDALKHVLANGGSSIPQTMRDSAKIARNAADIFLEELTGCCETSEGI